MPTQKIESYRDLIVWQKSISLVVMVYTVTKKFPPDEMFGLISQMRRAAVSIPSNIAEGKYRYSTKEFLHFLRIAYASGAELETQIEISRQLFHTCTDDLNQTQAHLSEIMKMLNTLIRKLS